ncbi:DEAD/DEAH box helicase [Candidatus Saccharibacteria bacterium]|nr:DEAD/DEAH box helicase [Candidatus Saccharibacteria bacterium]
MYKNNYSRSPRRTTTRSYGSSNRQSSKNARQNIHPSRFVKEANPAQTADYTSDNNFADFAIHPLIKSNIAYKGYKVPSEIQDKTIPLGLLGNDVVGIANTGTGKTAAFAVPILNKLLHHKTEQALIIAPTRELAIQIEDQCKKLAKNSGLYGALLIGGLSIGRQISSLRAGATIIIGTPGRIKDHLKQGTLDLGKCKMVVLDEVDRMLDMGFINDVRFILDTLPEQRQSFFFSATMSPEINRLIQTFTVNPVTVDVKAGDTSDNVHQDIIPYETKQERLDLLHDLLIKDDVKKTLIFGETKYGTERLGQELKTRGFSVDSLHGGKSQSQRQRTMDNFRQGATNILVATDVAARGIDVIDITHVVNFDLPHTYDDYTHRIGRAGRAGNIGHALTFVPTRP